MRLFVLVRHAQSVLNLEHRVNGDPTRPADLTEVGRLESIALGLQVKAIPLTRCVHTRFARTRDTAQIALEGRGVVFETEPLLDDIDVGDLEGVSIDDYRAWKRQHRRSDPFPGGESLDDAARRYARGFRSLLKSAAPATLVVCHEIPIRYALNAVSGSEKLDGPPVHDVANATPFLFDEQALADAANTVERLVPSS